MRDSTERLNREIEMNTTINVFMIQDLLRDAAPTPLAEKVAAWALANAHKFTPQEAKANGSPERLALARVWHLLSQGCLTDKAAAGAALMADYCRCHGVPYLATTENADLGLDFLARKFHYTDQQSLRQHQPELCDTLASALARHTWRSHYYVRLTVDDKDREFALNTFWRTWVSVAEGRWTDLLKEREKTSCEAAYADYDREELFAAVAAFLEANKESEYTYNEVAKAIKIHPSNLTGIMHTKDALNRLASPAQTVYQDVAQYRVKRGKRTAEVFRWAPARRKLEAAIPSRRDAVITGEIMASLDAQPYQSVRAIQAHCRHAFGKIDNAKVIMCLRSLVADKVALTETGPRGALLHYPNPKMTAGKMEAGKTMTGNWS